MKLVYIGLVMLLAGCAGNRPEAPERIPDEEVAAYREAAEMMSRHIVLEDSAYHFTIGRDAAVDSGIPGCYYDRMVQELEYTNYLIREKYNKKGINIDLSDYETDIASDKP
ncbi:MAG: hypothetical protein NC117_09085 [Pseudoflavonifractor sp.]|nr:hypothetical protein [Pseudoflavonifractor sp.]